MAQRPSVNKPWRLLMPATLYERLNSHLFPGDLEEHGAVILAGIAETPRDVRLLARELHVAEDGRDYVSGTRSHRMLRAEFIDRQVVRARDQGLTYLAVHNHPSTDHVAFSGIDLHSHELGYPALLDITRGGPVGALVFGKRAVAGDIWCSGKRRVDLSRADVIGRSLLTLTSEPPPESPAVDQRFDRQVRMFGHSGQAILSQARVAIIGLGGGGSILAEFLARLGVGRFVLVDSDRVDPTNLPRLIGATRRDCAYSLQDPGLPRWLRRIGHRLATRKVDLARRNILRANQSASVEVLATDFTAPGVASHVKDCDYIFLAADTMRARTLFNAVIHQYLIPGVQVGAKVTSDRKGSLTDVFAVSRPVSPVAGCLWCNGLINAAKLQEEALPDQERQRQAYVDAPDVVAPSVIALNALAASQAVSDFMLYMTGLADNETCLPYRRFEPVKARLCRDHPSAAPNCIECSSSPTSRLAMGDGFELPGMAM